MKREKLLGDLAALAGKYRELAVLRARRDEVEAGGAMSFDDEENQRRREAFGRVARAFPGALRELERTSADVLRRKQRAVELELAAAVADDTRDAPATRWIAVVLDYHALLRDALAIKLWIARRLGRDGELTDEVVADLLAWHARRAEPEVWRTRALDRAFFVTLRNPPRGRIHPIIWAELIARHGGDEAELVSLIFG